MTPLRRRFSLIVGIASFCTVSATALVHAHGLNDGSHRHVSGQIVRESVVNSRITGAVTPRLSPRTSDDTATEVAETTEVEEETTLTENEARLIELTEYFSNATVLAGPEIVDCTLSGGTETECFSITVDSSSPEYTPGPWCPTSGTTSAANSGKWVGTDENESSTLYDADGEFMANLAEFYGDDNWQMVDPDTGEINVTETKEQCEAAAVPDVPDEYANYCVACSFDHLDEGIGELTYVIPFTPVDASSVSSVNNGIGVAYNGVRIDGPAPVADILAGYTIATFDDCGGHINPGIGYHYHAITDCQNDGAPSDTHGSVVGIALDGYSVYSNLMVGGISSSDLDECSGHDSNNGMGYHYHAGEEGSNQITGCLVAETGCALSDADTECDASSSDVAGLPEDDEEIPFPIEGELPSETVVE